MTDLERLTAARDLLSNKARWTQGFFAHDEDGEQVACHAREAVCWCAYGAIIKVSPSPMSFSPAGGLLERAAADLFGISAVEVNDRHPWEDVLAMFDRAIEFAS